MVLQILVYFKGIKMTCTVYSGVNKMSQLLAHLLNGEISDESPENQN